MSKPADICFSWLVQVLSSRNVELVLGYIVSSIRSTTETGISTEGNGNASNSSGVTKYQVDLKLATSRRRSDSSQLEADLVLWTVGTKATVPSAEQDREYPAFPVNGRGQADTDENLRVKGHPRIFAIGDSAGTKDSSGRNLPSTAQVSTHPDPSFYLSRLLQLCFCWLSSSCIHWNTCLMRCICWRKLILLARRRRNFWWFPFVFILGRIPASRLCRMELMGRH